MMAELPKISEKDRQGIEVRTEMMKRRNVPFTSTISVYYDYGPLGEGKMPTTTATINFWPPKEEDSQQQRNMETKLDAAKAEWKSTAGYKNLRTLLAELSENVEVSKIVGLGLGSLNSLSFASEEIQYRNSARSYTQLAIVLVMQEELKYKPKLILQDPAYGDNDIDFVTKSGPPGGVQVTNDPDGFNLIDDKTIFFNIGGYSEFWYRVQNGLLPTVIITDHLEIRVGDKPMLKPQEDLLKKYKAREIAPKGAKGLGVNRATKFWTLCG
ncbi:uncharacterized protein N7443_001775 [Penicillium atrosanguineum]|uniref:SRR1-like domain-containing protein n=1 Tax=Penicillium atrosanguineum TaxID=1132637 RepID=A0A9W9PZ11_9EURO|nr:uncharacterized protein N7443_001775 [Penicillium atrosanguineum]KAJ5309314.1 hypothetical protein N7443_001775 [Penicillium atrosanguineum]KAJ5318577.1 hypothetical protein N7476_004997 [Penicillium atrosanguineum]